METESEMRLSAAISRRIVCENTMASVNDPDAARADMADIVCERAGTDARRACRAFLSTHSTVENIERCIVELERAARLIRASNMI